MKIKTFQPDPVLASVHHYLFNFAFSGIPA